eukprot:84838-Alexandrium_andersonii.AAC.1
MRWGSIWRPASDDGGPRQPLGHTQDCESADRRKGGVAPTRPSDDLKLCFERCRYDPNLL